MSTCIVSPGYELAPVLKEPPQSVQGNTLKVSTGNCVPGPTISVQGRSNSHGIGATRSSSSSDISAESMFSEDEPFKEMISTSSLLSTNIDYDDCSNILSLFEDILSESDESLGSFPSMVSFGHVEQENSDITMRDSMDSISFETEFGCDIEAIDRSPGISSANLYCTAAEFSPENILSDNLPTVGEEWSCEEFSNLDALAGARPKLLEKASLMMLPDLVSPPTIFAGHGLPKHAANCDLMQCSGFDLGNTAETNSDAHGNFTSCTQEPQEENGLQIVHLLLSCMEAIDAKNSDSAKTILACLRRKSSRIGDPMERLGVYFAEALDERLKRENFNKMLVKKNVESFSIVDGAAADLARRAFYKHLPFLKYVHLTENQAIFDALRGENRIHVVDLDIGHGLQWASFIQSLSVRSESLVSFRLTAVGLDDDCLKQTGKRLSQFAQELHVPFEFMSIFATVEDIDSTMFHVNGGEALAVSCSFIFHRLLQSKLSLAKALTTIRNLQPKVVSVLETEVNHSATFVHKFLEALHFFSALFDALDTTLERTDSERLLIENNYLAREIRNLIAMDGFNSSIKHPQTERWSSYLKLAGLRELSLSSSAIYQAQLFIDSHSPSYRLNQDGLALTLGWHDTPIMSVSTWTF